MFLKSYLHNEMIQILCIELEITLVQVPKQKQTNKEEATLILKTKNI